ncbi:MAG: LytR/AlgR family response regulator transcription factor [Flammeovirgaceae bacterium]
MKIVVIEDQKFWQESLVKEIEKLGHKVLATISEKKHAKSKIEQLKPDFMIIDIGLGSDSYAGIDVAREIKDLHIPFAYLTQGKLKSDETESIHAKAFKSGSGNAKPIKFLYKSTYTRNPQRALRELFQEVDFHEPLYLQLKGDQLIAYTDILWIEGKGRNWEIHDCHGKTHFYYGPLKTILEQEKTYHTPQLRQANRNCLINIYQVKRIKRDKGPVRIFYFDDDYQNNEGIVASESCSPLLTKEWKEIHSKRQL